MIQSEVWLIYLRVFISFQNKQLQLMVKILQFLRRNMPGKNSPTIYKQYYIFAQTSRKYELSYGYLATSPIETLDAEFDKIISTFTLTGQ